MDSNLINECNKFNPIFGMGFVFVFLALMVVVNYHDVVISKKISDPI